MFLQTVVNQIKFNFSGTDFGPIRKWLLLVGLVGLETLILFNLALNDSSLARSWFEQSQEVESLRKKLNQISKSFQTLQKNSQATESLLESLDASGLNSQVLEKIALLATLNQLSLKEINFLQTEASLKPGLSQRSVDLTLLGNYENLISFLAAVDQEIPSMVIKSLKIGLLEKPLGASVISTKISLLIYYSQEN